MKRNLEIEQMNFQDFFGMTFFKQKLHEIVTIMINTQTILEVIKDTREKI